MKEPKFKNEEEQMEEIIQTFKEKGINVKRKIGYGVPSQPSWSASIGEKMQKN